MDLISVVIPVYKVEKYIDQCVSSVVHQTYKNLEIILVNDGSPDGCPALCDAWALKDSRIKVIHKVNGGLSDARNAGLAIAKGSLIAFVDSDDWIESQFLEILVATIKRYDCDIAFCNALEFFEDETAVNLCPNTNKVEVFTAAEAISALIDDRIRQVVWNKLYRKSILSGISFATGKYHEDEFWSYQVIGNSLRVAGVDYGGYHYLQRRESIMGSAYSLKRLDAVEAKCQRQDYLERHYPTLALHGRISLLFTCLYHGQQALRIMEKPECGKAFEYLEIIWNRYSLHRYKTDLKFTSRLWLSTASVSLRITCHIRNRLHIGL